MRGRFITFEGGEGAGKSTHSATLAQRLRGFGLGVVLTREPGGSPGAEIIRHVLLSGAAKPAIPHGRSYDEVEIFTYTMTFNFTGWPAAVLCCGTSHDGLPIGVQIAAHPWREDIALALAQHLEDAIDCAARTTIP